MKWLLLAPVIAFGLLPALYVSYGFMRAAGMAVVGFVRWLPRADGTALMGWSSIAVLLLVLLYFWA